ncbi:hypothetical protein [Embleya sp. NPDC005575]|uniref:hypothetical protein n=1 Tax=Embleya sp. NPDC005575 TaxID=3156892 RepID=UPI0033AAC4F7
MPGQRKRKQRQQEQRRRDAARFAPDAGHWEVVFETQDQAEGDAHLRRMRAEDADFDPSAIRIEILCGRLTNPSSYRLSRFVPNPTSVPAEEHTAG